MVCGVRQVPLWRVGRCGQHRGANEGRTGAGARREDGHRPRQAHEKRHQGGPRGRNGVRPLPQSYESGILKGGDLF